MKFLLLRNEKDIKEVTDSAYKDLSGTARKQAEAALLKANPALKSFRSVRKGFMVRVPTAIDGEKLERRNVVDPIEQLTEEASDYLDQFEKVLTEKYDAQSSRDIATSKKLKAASKSLKQLPQGPEIAKNIKKHLTESAALNEKTNERSREALRTLKKTLNRFEP